MPTEAPAVARFPESAGTPPPRLHRRYLWGLAGMLLFVAAMFGLEQLGLARRWIAAIFLLGPVVMYASIGVACRTMEPLEYYVGGRRVPAIYNGMAIGADWMSVASFLGLTGILYLTGFGGLAYVMGWTGGFCLIAFGLAPYLRRSGQFTIPDFLAERYGGRLPRLIALAVSVLISFVYVIAQVYGVGLVTSRLTGFTFEIGVLVGLGGILVCSFLGGMRAVTWTQVAQYGMLLLAFLLPVVWLSVKQTGVVLPQAVTGVQLARIGERERELLADPREQQVRTAYREDAQRYAVLLADVERGLAAERAAAHERVESAIARNAPLREIQAAERAQQALPRDAAEAREAWSRARELAEQRTLPLGGMPPHARPFAGSPEGGATPPSGDGTARANFIALVFCLVAGTAGMPHVLARFYTTPDVPSARRSVTWAVLFIVLLYVSAPTLAILLKAEVLTHVVGTPIERLPGWIVEWARVDPALLSFADVNHDGVLQLGELHIHGDILVLAAPEIAGMPFAASCLVAAGALAAALSTADGLLLTTANALAHDFYFRLLDPTASHTRRVAVSKVVLLVVALLAAYIATRRPAAILHLVTPVFSIAAATIFPALLLGIFWKRTSSAAACAGMLSGLAVTLYYVVTRDPLLQPWIGRSAGAPPWWGIQPGSAGVFGVPVAFGVTALVSLLKPAPPADAAWVEAVRRPDDGPAS